MCICGAALGMVVEGCESLASASFQLNGLRSCHSRVVPLALQVPRPMPVGYESAHNPSHFHL